jgi:hypothetical protein
MAARAQGEQVADAVVGHGADVMDLQAAGRAADGAPALLAV